MYDSQNDFIKLFEQPLPSIQCQQSKSQKKATKGSESNFIDSCNNDKLKTVEIDLREVGLFKEQIQKAKQLNNLIKIQNSKQKRQIRTIKLKNHPSLTIQSLTQSKVIQSNFQTNSPFCDAKNKNKKKLEVDIEILKATEQDQKEHQETQESSQVPQKISLQRKNYIALRELVKKQRFQLKKKLSQSNHNSPIKTPVLAQKQKQNIASIENQDQESFDKQREVNLEKNSIDLRKQQHQHMASISSIQVKQKNQSKAQKLQIPISFKKQINHILKKNKDDKQKTPQISNKLTVYSDQILSKSFDISTEQNQQSMHNNIFFPNIKQRDILNTPEIQPKQPSLNKIIVQNSKTEMKKNKKQDLACNIQSINKVDRRNIIKNLDFQADLSNLNSSQKLNETQNDLKEKVKSIKKRKSYLYNQGSQDQQSMNEKIIKKVQQQYKLNNSNLKASRLSKNGIQNSQDNSTNNLKSQITIKTEQSNLEDSRKIKKSLQQQINESGQFNISHLFSRQVQKILDKFPKKKKEKSLNQNDLEETKIKEKDLSVDYSIKNCNQWQENPDFLQQRKKEERKMLLEYERLLNISIENQEVFYQIFQHQEKIARQWIKQNVFPDILNFVQNSQLNLEI